MQFRPIRSDDRIHRPALGWNVHGRGGRFQPPPFPVGPTNMTLKGQPFASAFTFPTAHGILRHNGVEMGKRDFLGVN
jgi:hypothetical protein